MEQIKVFLDSNVVISFLISKTGASFQLIHLDSISKNITLLGNDEINEVAKRLKIKDKYQINKILKKLTIIKIGISKNTILDKYSKYTLDKEDSHIIAGAYESKSKFLLTYNIRHYNIDLIKNELGIIVLKPGNFLQYLRSN